MLRTVLALCALMLSVLLAGCGGAAEPGLEPAAPASGDRPGPVDEETPVAEETMVYEPAEPVVVDMGETGAAGQPDEEEEMDGEGREAPAPGARDPLAKLVEEARQSLAARLGLTADDITVERTEDVTWPDASLGCPDPEMMYAQALIPGYRIVLRAGDQTYSYHGSERGQLVLCGKDGKPVR